MFQFSVNTVRASGNATVPRPGSGSSPRRAACSPAMATSPPPLRAIVAEAGVSVQSVHLAGPKSSLVLAAWEHAFAGDEGAHSLLQRPAMAQMLAELDSAVALSHFVAFIVEANARGAGFWRAMRTAADADPQEGAAVSA